MNNSFSCVLSLAALAAGVAVPAMSVSAATIAYYSFEGTAGDTVTSVADQSGYGNTAAWQSGSPTYTSSVPGATIPQTGAANTTALSTTDSCLLVNGSAASFDAYTIEVSVSFNKKGVYRIMGVDNGVMTDFYVKMSTFQLITNVWGRAGSLGVEFMDSSGAFLYLRTGEDYIAEDQWYNVAVTNDGKTASLYIKTENDTSYKLIDSVSVSGVNKTTGNFAIGRGIWNEQPGNNLDGRIDELRISNTVLQPSEFLFSAVPEPATLGLLAVVALPMMAGRKRRN